MPREVKPVKRLSLQCPSCASRAVTPFLPTTDTIELRCRDCGSAWALPLPQRAHRPARFTASEFNIWRSAVERRRRRNR
jgi:uncharacterized Zn finger protein